MENQGDPPSKTSISGPCSPPTPSMPARPSERREKAALISRLLSHFWTADDPQAARQAQIEDWLEDLAEFSPEVVAEACRDWRRWNEKRPTIAGILALCRSAVERSRLRGSRHPVLTWEEARALAERWVVGHGYDNLEDFLDHGQSVSLKIGRGEWAKFGPREAVKGPLFEAAKWRAAQSAPVGTMPGMTGAGDAFDRVRAELGVSSAEEVA